MSIDVDKLLREKFIHPFKKVHIPFQGFTISKRYSELKEELDNVEVDDRDVWVCTFPKVGTTWTQEMLWMITNNVDFEKSKQLLEERSPFIDLSIIYDDREWYGIRDDYNPPLYVHDSIAFYKSVKSPKIVKTHLPFSFLPKQIKDGIKKPKMVFVVRDSKDTCVSYFHHSKLVEGFVGTFEEWCELFLAGKVNYGPYWKYVLEYWENRHSQDMLIIKYEDMKEDIVSIIHKVSTFLNRSLTNIQIQQLAKHLSFEAMKNNPAVNKHRTEDFNKLIDNTTASGKFMRSGKVGDHKRIMSPEIITRFEDWNKKWLRNTDFVLYN